MDNDYLNRYSRHIFLDPIGIEGQDKISRSTMAIIGVGGLGCVSALYLVASGIKKIILIDHDKVSLTNLQRQILYSESAVGYSKVQSAKETLEKINSNVTIDTIEQQIKPENITGLLKDVDVILDCSDNYQTRHLLNKAISDMQKPLVSGAVTAFDGQLSVFDLRVSSSPCYNCLFKESDYAEDDSCATMGIFSPLAGMVGTLMAGEAIKVIAMPSAAVLTGRLLAINILDAKFKEIKLVQDPNCSICQQRTQI